MQQAPEGHQQDSDENSKRKGQCRLLTREFRCLLANSNLYLRLLISIPVVLRWCSRWAGHVSFEGG